MSDVIDRDAAIAALKDADLAFGYGRAVDAIRALPAVDVGVKPLEWVETYTYGGKAYDAVGINTIYRIVPKDGGEFYLTDPDCSGFFTTLEAAKAAAQADYAARIRSALTIAPAVSPYEHYDNYAIEQFAKMMREKMSASRAKGRSGWSDPEKCSVEYLRSLLYEHLDKGDPVDVANICMMLRHHEASTALVPAPPELFDPEGNWADFIKSAYPEAEKAMRKYPQPNYVISKVAEEAGEVVKAAIHCAEGRETAENVRAEMRQLIAMLYRLWIEGDQVHGLPPVSSALAHLAAGLTRP